jgi:hypothetical protein
MNAMVLSLAAFGFATKDFDLLHSVGEKRRARFASLVFAHAQC